MEFVFPVPKQSELIGQFSEKWLDFVTRFSCHQDENGTARMPFLFHYGKNFIENVSVAQGLSSEDLSKFSNFVQSLEQECLFQIALTFLRYLFLSHCHKTGSGAKDFFTELKLLSEWCSFDDETTDNLIKDGIIDCLPEGGLREVLTKSVSLTASDMADVCAKVKEQIDDSELLQLQAQHINIIEPKNKKQKLFQTSSDTKKDHRRSSYQETQMEINNKMDLTTALSTDLHDCVNEGNASISVSESLIKKEIKEENSNFDSLANSLTPTDICSYSDPTSFSSYIPSHVTITSLQKTFHQSTRMSSTCHQTSSSSLNNCPSSESAMVAVIVDSYCQNPPSTSTSRVESPIVEMKKTSAKPVTVMTTRSISKQLNADTYDDTTIKSDSDNSANSAADDDGVDSHPNADGAKNPSVDDDSNTDNGCDIKNDIVSYPNVDGSDTDNVAKMKIDGKDTPAVNSVRPQIFTNDITQSYCCQQQAMIKTGQIVESESHRVNEYSCNFCVFKCPGNAGMEKHVLQEHKSLTCFVCMVCNSKFPFVEQFESHVKSRHMSLDELAVYDNDSSTIHKPSTSHTTGTTLLSAGPHYKGKSLKPKKKVKVRRFPCQYCSHVCDSNWTRICHHRTHTGERPYMCDECGKGFALLHTLYIHTRTHTGEKPYKCQYCHRTFLTSSNRLMHERRHRNERAYVCEQCGKAFIKSHDLRLHMVTHIRHRLRPFKCYCGKDYMTKKALKHHATSHSYQFSLDQ